MEDERLKRIIDQLLALIVGQDQQILDLTASVVVLKLAVAKLQGTAPESALADFREQEQKALKQIPVSRRLQDVRDLLEHGDDVGKHRA
jgi:hypothetical protein